MTGSRRLRLLAPVLGSLGLVAWAALSLLATPVAAFQVEQRGTDGLDGRVVMSPAAERIETVEADGGEQIGPGSVVRRPVIIHNRTEDPVTFDLDVAQVVGSNAELVVEVRHGVREGAAAWVTLERTTFTLQPGEQGTMVVTVRIPKDVKPGSKPFAVTATQRSAPVQSEGAGIAPVFKQVGIFILELPGDAPVKGSLTDAAITSAQKGVDAAGEGEQTPRNARFYVGPGLTDTHRLSLTAEYSNEGERLIRPTGRVIVKDIFGRTAGTYQLKDFTAYPGGEAAQTVELKGLPSLGLFTATVELESEPTGRQSTTLPRFVMVPKWFLAAAGAFLLYWLYRLVRWRLAKRREWQAYLGEDDVDVDDDSLLADDDWAVEDEPERV